MTLPSGTISMSQVNTELGHSASASLSMSSVRAPFGKGTTVDLDGLRGLTYTFTWNYTIPNGTMNFNLKSAAIAAGWDQIARLIATVTVASGSVIGASSTGSYAFETDSGYPAGTTIILINNGYIEGAGGTGGAPSTRAGGAGTSGGPALVVRVPITVYNYGVIGGGGGGGGASGGCVSATQGALSGAAGGGGRGSTPGSGASWSSPGAGSAGRSVTDPQLGSISLVSPGGSGGNLGTPGATGAAGYSGTEATLGGLTCDGAPFYNLSQDVGYSGGSGGSPGNCSVSVGAGVVTWSASGSRYGTIA